MSKDELIKEIQIAMINKGYYGDYAIIYEFLSYIEDTTVLGDILADLKG